VNIDNLLNPTTICEMLVKTDTGLKCKCGSNAEFKCKTHPAKSFCGKCYEAHSRYYMRRRK